MNLAEYQKLAKRTLGDACLTNLRMGVIGETGEIVDYTKKVIYHGHELKREKLIEELGDLMWYVMSIATAEGVTFVSTCTIKDRGLVWSEMDQVALNIADRVYEMIYGGYEVDYIDYIILFEELEQLALFVNSTLSDVMEYNIKKLEKRYPNGFEEKRSINRG